MKTFLTAVLLLIGVTCFGQVTPQYYIERHLPGFAPPVANQTAGNDSTVSQSLLVLDSFNTGKPPHGKLKNIYVRTGTVNTNLWKGCKSTKVLISLGNSSLSNFDTVTNWINGLTLIASVDTLTTDTTKGSWIKIPIKGEINFLIDTTKNLVFEFTLDSGGLGKIPPAGAAGCEYLMSRFTWGVPSAAYGLWGAKYGTFQKMVYFFDVGFDLYPNPANIEATQNVTDLRIYPNPSSGKLIISMAAERAVKEAQLTVSDMAGRVVWQQQYQNIDENFYQDIDMSAYPKGIYLAELRADGERLTKKLVVH